MLAGLFAGAALYVSAVEVPSEFEASPWTYYKRFPFLFRRAAKMQASLAGVGATAAAVTAAGSGHCSQWLWGASAALIGAVIPYTLMVMMPTNKAIFKQDTADEAQQKELLARWARLHLVRTVLSCTSFGLMAWTMHAVRPGSRRGNGGAAGAAAGTRTGAGNSSAAAGNGGGGAGGFGNRRAGN